MLPLQVICDRVYHLGRLILDIFVDLRHRLLPGMVVPGRLDSLTLLLLGLLARLLHS
jgi:hypothetical protein